MRAHKAWRSRSTSSGRLLVSLPLSGRGGPALCGAVMLAASALAVPLPASAAAPDAEDLTKLSLDQLMEIEVTSVSKTPERLFDAPAAVSVITQEDIRRSGMTTVPDLLRLVPGLDVAQVSGDLWAVSSRGFNNDLANKLLVLIDGRSVYTLTDAGVNWDVQRLMLEDVERIEVIRGSGGALWGANAVNGVINIITKTARDTQGGLLSVTTGSIDQPSVSVRYGGKVGASSYLRVYGQGFGRQAFKDVTGASAHDGSNGTLVGFRLDSTPSDRDTVMLDGAAYHEHSNNRIILTSLTPPPPGVTLNTDHNVGGHLLLNWRRALAEESDFTLQVYYDRADRTRTMREDERVDTLDVDFERHQPLSETQKLVWGLGYRSVWTRFDNVFSISFLPPDQRIEIYSAFVQDQIALRPNLELTVGSKFEHNNFSGFEYEPNIRLSWAPSHDRSLWAAVSRAVRMPALLDRNFQANSDLAPGPLPTVISIRGSHDFESEEVLAFEAGYSSQVSANLLFGASGFFNRYDRLFTVDPETPVLDPSPFPHLVVPLRFGNRMHGETYGAELLAKWQATEHWRVSSSYTWFKAQMRLDPSSLSTDTELSVEKNSPEHQFQIHSQLDLPHEVQFDSSLYYVSRLGYPTVPSYTRLDLRLAWRPRENLELSLAGQNLLDGRHQEFKSPTGNTELPPVETPRSVHAQLLLTF